MFTKQSVTIYPVQSVLGHPSVPGDKSISHRVMILGSLAEGRTKITNLLQSADVQSTQRCLESLGVEMIQNKDEFLIWGKGLQGLNEPKCELDCGNSGTTLRLLLGVLAGQNFATTLTGDRSLCRRPMRRISEPLETMGPRIQLSSGDFAPVRIHGRSILKPIDYSLTIGSAQIKTALLLAGLYGDGKTTLRGKIQSRDHTERLLPLFGIPIEKSLNVISIEGRRKMVGNEIQVPSDFSSAAYWIAAALIVPYSKIEICNVSLNPSRLGFLNVIKRMGANIVTEITKEFPEEVGRIYVSTSRLQGTEILPDEIPGLVDEIPLISILATFAEGRTVVRGAEELRVKESDRIQSLQANLQALGARLETFTDGFTIEGPQALKGGKVFSFGDHRIAMTFSIAALAAQDKIEIDGSECVSVSYPRFYQTLQELVA